MILLFLLTLWLGSYLTKDFWGKAAAKVVTVINILIAIPVILNIKNVDFLTSIALSIGYAAVFVALNVLIALLILGYDSIFGGSSSDTTQEETKKEPPPSEEQQTLTQEEFSKYEKYCLDVKGKVKCEKIVSDKDCLLYMIHNGKLKSKNGNILTLDMVIKMMDHRTVTDKCIELELDPKKKEDRESAEYLIKADKYDEEDDYDYDDDDDDGEEDCSSSGSHYDDDEDEEEEDNHRSWGGSTYTPKQNTRSATPKPDRYHYEIQYKFTSNSPWQTHVSLMNESTAEIQFDQFVDRKASSFRHMRLVQKNQSGKIVTVLRSC
jgi:hypothetical protein